MIEKIKNFMKNRNNLVMIVLAGILLMVIALPVEKAGSGNNGSGEETKNNTRFLNTEAEGGEEEKDADAYVAAMERKVEEILGEMEGAGRVRVIITLRSSMEKIVEKDGSTSLSDTSEEDSQGGTRTVSIVDAGESTVYTSEGNVSEPYVVKTLSPEVEGVVVLAEGAGSGRVSNNIADAIQVLFGIEAHRIKVIKMETQNRQE